MIASADVAVRVPAAAIVEPIAVGTERTADLVAPD